MIEYGTNETWRWDGEFEEVRFHVSADGNPILCRLSREFIEDHCGNPSTPKACLDAAKERFDEITDIIGHWVANSRFEKDGSVLLRTGDWR